MPDTFVFYNPVKIEDTYWYRYDKSSAILDPDQTSGDMKSIEEIRSNKTFWILANKHAYRESSPAVNQRMYHNRARHVLCKSWRI